MRIIFFGASGLGFDCCNTILENGHNVVSIFTLPSEFSIKYKNESTRTVVRNSLFRDFSYFKHRYNIPVVILENGIGAFEDYIKSLKPDLIVVIGWYFIMPRSILSCAPKGCIGIHGSLLPKYRGNAPLVWAMINGEKQTGVSLFYFANGIDNGDIIGQESFPIADTDTIADVLQKASLSSRNLLSTHLPLIATDSAVRTKQDDSQATYYGRREPKDGLIDWSWSTERIRNFIRAQTRPYPGAYTMISGRRVTIWDATIVDVKSDL